MIKDHLGLAKSIPKRLRIKLIQVNFRVFVCVYGNISTPFSQPKKKKLVVANLDAHELLGTYISQKAEKLSSFQSMY